MAALNRPVTATYAVNETVRVDTQGNDCTKMITCTFSFFPQTIQMTQSVTPFSD